MTVETFLTRVFWLSVAINIVSLLMFLGRVHWPKTSDLYGNIALLLGIPALVLGIVGMVSGIGVAYWLMPLIYVAFAIFALIVDVVLKVEFRQPRRPAILVPFLILYFVPLIAMWGMLWNLGLVNWAISGITYFAMMGSSFYALSKGVG